MSPWKPGDRCRFRGGAFSGGEGRILSVDGEAAQVEVSVFGNPLATAARLEDLEPVDPTPPPEDGPFRRGDSVFLHDGPCRGGRGRVLEPLARDQVRVALDGGEEVSCHGSDLVLLLPRRRPLIEDIELALRRLAPQGGWSLRERLWWLDKPDQPAASLGELRGLAEAFEAHRGAVHQRMHQEIEARLGAAREALAARPDQERPAWWMEHWAEFLDWRAELGRVRAEEVAPRVLEEAELPAPGEPLAREQESAVDRALERARDLERAVLEFASTAPREPLAYAAAPPPPALLPRRVASPAAGERAFGRALPRDGALSSEQALERIARARAHLAHPYDAGFRDRWSEIATLVLELLASGQEEGVRFAVEQAVRAAAPGLDHDIEAITLRGCEAPTRWPENPWGLTADMAAPVRTLFSPLADRAGALTDTLARRTLGLALLRNHADGAPSLGYLVLSPFARHERESQGIPGEPPTTIDATRLGPWRGFASLGAVLAGPPRAPCEATLEALPDFPLPAGLRALMAVHDGILGPTGTSLRPAAQLGPVLDFALSTEELVGFTQANGGAAPEQFVAFADDLGGNCWVFDRGAVSENGDPEVAFWDHETWEAGPRESFDSWLGPWALRWLLAEGA